MRFDWLAKLAKIRNSVLFFMNACGEAAHKIQLNDYETAPYFIQFSQNLTCDCLLISEFSPEFT